MKKILDSIHRSKFIGFFIRTLDYCLWKELKDCETVLDLGCGPASPISNCKNIKYKVGVEVFAPYLRESKKKHIHDKYIKSKIEKVNFPNKSFDAVMMIEVLEHLPKKEGLEILKKAERWARKKVIVSSPNGFIDQQEIDNNPYQKHLSGWDIETFNRLGFKSVGLAGLKFLRSPRKTDTNLADLTTSIRFWPKPLWFAIASLSQTITYRIPKLAFELFLVKTLNETTEQTQKRSL